MGSTSRLEAVALVLELVEQQGSNLEGTGSEGVGLHLVIGGVDGVEVNLRQVAGSLRRGSHHRD